VSASWTITHDFAFSFGGAERVLRTMKQNVLPAADVLAIAGDPAVLRRIEPSGHAGRLLTGRWLTPRNYRYGAFAVAPTIDLRPPIEGNLLSLPYAFAHHFRCTGTHVSYCHSPLRQLWSHRGPYMRASGPGAGAALFAASIPFRGLDRHAAARVDTYIATSSVVRNRIENFYGREVAAIIPPPIDVDRFRPVAQPTRDFYLWVGRIVEPYKRLESLVRAFDGVDAELVVAGTGRDEAAIKRLATPNVRFLGSVEAAELSGLYANARAVLFPSEDDFGMVPVEAMASGTPVIAYRRGGALDTVVEGKTGVFFNDHSAKSITGALAEFETVGWSADAIREHAEYYGVDRFAERMRGML
jgi:glycosyltransferase involved in cell wall biosynthesis